MQPCHGCDTDSNSVLGVSLFLMIFKMEPKFFSIIAIYHDTMAKNTGNNSRKGAVKSRSQVENPKTGLYAKRGPDGKFQSVKTSGGKYKGVRKE